MTGSCRLNRLDIKQCKKVIILGFDPLVGRFMWFENLS